MTQNINDPLASVLIIGAMKAGTTQLFYTLAAHPQVNACLIKEPNFFLDYPHAGNWSRGDAWYRSLFRDTPGLRMEASTAYTKDYLDERIPLRIRSLCPNAKLIYLVRNPVDRAISHYLHSVAEGREDRGIQEALLSPTSIYIRLSRYYLQLTPYLNLFPYDQLLIVRAESLWKEPQITLGGILHFLGIDDIELPLSENRHSTIDRIAYLKQFGMWSKDHHPWIEEIEPLIKQGQSPGARSLGELLGLTRELQKQLEEEFVGDQQKLQHLRSYKIVQNSTNVRQM